MHIQDAVHGYIVLNDVEEELVDTATMQRLRRVKQLGFSQLVYPSATHSRFEHSLGACHLAGTFADQLDLDAEERQHLRFAALFHDTGHGPYSHAADFIYQKHGTSHEAYSKTKVREDEIGDILRDHGYSPDQVVEMISGDGALGSIIAGHIDVDRMDYLIRDAHYTGVAYGTIDADTIIRAAEKQGGRIVFDAKYVNALESLLTARYLMTPTVYMHRTSRIGTRMFRELFAFLAEDDLIAVNDLAEMDEPALLSIIRDSEHAWLGDRILDRDLYKIAHRTTDLPDMDEQELEARLQEETGLDRGEVLIDTIELDDAAYDVPIKKNGEITTLDAISPLPTALQDALQQQELRIYCDRDDIDRVHAAAAQLLD